MGISKRNIKEITKFGREHAKLTHELGHEVSPDGIHHPGDRVGSIWLEAYRESGPLAALELIAAYQRGYDSYTEKHGLPDVRKRHIREGLFYSLPGASPEELQALKNVL